jgi:hypothetical protein
MRGLEPSIYILHPSPLPEGEGIFRGYLAFFFRRSDRVCQNPELRTACVVYIPVAWIPAILVGMTLSLFSQRL